MTAPSGSPIASVVVATHERAHLLPRLLGALETQVGAGSFEVIVVDDASEDGTWRTLQALVRDARIPLRPFRLERNSGPATARNAGWRAARAPLVAFTDDDCVPRPTWLSALTAALGEADLVQGRTLPDPAQLGNTGPFSRTQEITAENGFYQTCNIGYRRALLEGLDGFDDRLHTGEDTELAWRARATGARSVFEPAALVHHDIRPSSFLVNLRDTSRWAGVVLAVRLHPGLRDHLYRHWFWKDSHPPAILAAVGLLIGGRPRSTTLNRLVGLGLLATYVHYRSRSNPLRGGPRRRLAAIPAALVVDLAEVGVMAAASVRERTLLL